MSYTRDAYYIRIIQCVHANDYMEELKVAYPDTPLIHTHIRVFHNSAKWHTRLLSDLSYKKFKNITLTQYKETLWRLDMTEVDMDVWFRDDLCTYVDRKLQDYYDDDGSNLDEFSVWKMFKDTPALPERVKDIVKMEGTYVTIPSLEHTLDDKYVVTQTELMAFAAFVVFYFLNPNIDNEDLSVDAADYEICPMTHTVLFWRNKFTPKQSRYLVLRLLNWDGDVTDIQRFVNRIHDLTSTPCYQSFIDQFGVTFNSLDTSLGIAIEDAFPLTAEFDASLSVDDQFTKVQWTHLIGEQPSHSSKSAEKRTTLYKNTITNTVLLLPSSMHFFQELEVMSHDCIMHTDIGRSLFDRLYTISSNNVDDAMKDLTSCLNILTMMYKTSVVVRDTDGKYVLSPNKQRDLTAKFVSKFIDDTAETMASDALSQIALFLSMFMKHENVNSSQISRDLVDLGVKKIRKARGNVYCIRMPTMNEVSSFAVTLQPM